MHANAYRGQVQLIGGSTHHRVDVATEAAGSEKTGVEWHVTPKTWYNARRRKHLARPRLRIASVAAGVAKRPRGRAGSEVLALQGGAAVERLIGPGNSLLLCMNGIGERVISSYYSMPHIRHNMIDDC